MMQGRFNERRLKAEGLVRALTKGTTDAVFIVRQLQEKYLAANKRLYMAFVDLEKMFD